MVTVLFLKQVKEKYKSLYQTRHTLKWGNCLYEHTVCIKIRLHYIWKADESLRVTSGQVLKIRACYFLSNTALSVRFLWCCLSFEVKKYFARVWKTLLIAISIRTVSEQKGLFWLSHWFCNAWGTGEKKKKRQKPGHLVTGLSVSIMIFKNTQVCSPCITAIPWQNCYNFRNKSWGKSRSLPSICRDLLGRPGCEPWVHFTDSLAVVTSAVNPEEQLSLVFAACTLISMC